MWARVAAVCVLLVGAGCSDKGAGGDTAARTELRTAVDKTLAADSFHVEARGDIEDDTRPETSRSLVSSDYNAPDRLRTRTVTIGGPASFSVEIIDIGTDSFMAHGLGPSLGERKYEHRPAPSDSDQAGVERVLRPLRMARSAKTVERDGDVYVVEPGPGVRLRVSLAGGYVVRVVMRFAPQTAEGTGGISTPGTTMELTYSKFDRAEKVEPPPADQVVAGSADSNTSPSSPDPRASGPVALPPPTPGRTSTLQFRGVNALAESGCTGGTANPPAGDPAKLVYSEDTCYDLAPAGLEVRRVESFTAEYDSSGVLAVFITVGDDDADAFDRMAETYFQRQIAIVAFGRVLSAPTVQQREFRGEMVVSGLSRQDAADLKASLTRT